MIASLMQKKFTFMRARLRLILKLLLFLIASILINPVVSQERPVGINLTGIQDWSSEFVFVDAFKQSREWIPHENWSGAPWSSNVEIPLGPKGYPLEIPYDNGIDPDQAIRTLLFFGNLEGKYPGGMYRLIASGSGRISLWGAASGNFDCPVDTLVFVDSDAGGIALEIEQSQKSDPVRDIHFIMPGFHDSWETQLFHPDFLDFVKDFQAIRFMDWMKTNGSPVSEWEERNVPDFFTQTYNNGIAYEYIVELCNRLDKDAWICIPHMASDDFIEKMARFFREGLKPELKLYIEYSNEVWNGIFAQNHFAQSQGAQLGYAGESWEQGWQYYVKRTFDIFRIFENEFNNNDRLIKVVSGQAANSWLNNRLVEYSKDLLLNPDQMKADAFGIAPYFGGHVADEIGHAGLTGSISVDEIMDSLSNALQISYDWMELNKELADDNNMDIICYEAGQHLVASHLYNNDEAYVEKLKDANRHPEMKDLYCNYLDHWYEEIQGGLMGIFSSHGSYSKWGSWGVKEYMDEEDAPKYQAIKECVFSYNETSTENNNGPNKDKLKLYPNPSDDGSIWIKGDIQNATLEVYDLHGRMLDLHRIKDTESKISLNLKQSGLYLIVVKNNGNHSSFRLISL